MSVTILKIIPRGIPGYPNMVYPVECFDDKDYKPLPWRKASWYASVLAEYNPPYDWEGEAYRRMCELTNNPTRK